MLRIASTLFCIFQLLLTLLCDVIFYLLYVIAKILPSSHHSNQPTIDNDTVQQQLIQLRDDHSALLLQCEDISRRLTNIEESLQWLTQISLPVDTQGNQHSTVQLSTSDHFPKSSLLATPPRRRRPSSVGIPYPLPFIPPRTPEEIRRNNIIAWVNDMRLKATTNSSKGEGWSLYVWLRRSVWDLAEQEEAASERWWNKQASKYVTNYNKNR